MLYRLFIYYTMESNDEQIDDKHINCEQKGENISSELIENLKISSDSNITVLSVDQVNDANNSANKLTNEDENIKPSTKSKKSNIDAPNKSTSIGNFSKMFSSAKSSDTPIKTRKKSSHKVQIGTSENPLDVTNLAVNCGSLLDLYQNEYFDAYMHMYHLYHKKEPGVHEYLVNMLYTKRNNDEILFYLPQLCQLSISRYGKSSLHRFLLDRSSNSMYFALQLSWFYQCAIEDQLPKLDHLSQKMAQETEMAVVNCKLITPLGSNGQISNVDIPQNLSLPRLLDRRLFIRSLTKKNMEENGFSDYFCTDVNSLVSPKMPEALVHNTFTLSCPLSKVKLMGVHTKLGNVLDFETHPFFECTDDMQVELQRLMMKQRRLNYFNSLNHFVSLCMEVSSILTTEPKRDVREPLLKVFANALNEWMLLRRCTVAAYEESFLYTGLSLPFKSVASLKADQGGFQILRVVESEVRIFYSRKRTPFVFYFEIANLDEDIEYIAKLWDENIPESEGYSNSLEKSILSNNLTIKNLYVFDAIVKDLVDYDLLNDIQIAAINNPLECIRYAIGMLPHESLERYNSLIPKTIPEKLKIVKDTDHTKIYSTDEGRKDRDLYENKETVTRSSSQDNTESVDNDSRNTTMSNLSITNSNEKSYNLKNISSDEIKSIIWPEMLDQKRERIRKLSPYGFLKSWDICAFIFKGADDLRQEKMVQQMLSLFNKIFKKANLPLWLRPIEILVTGANSGIMEFLHDACSIDVIKRRLNTESIALVFDKLFADNIYEARRNFIESHAAYSIISYLLQVKDRHNGNIMLDSSGHVIHIDYGFCLSNSPGNINFETSPFKLTQEYMDILGGVSSDTFEYFRTLVIKGLLESRKYVDQIVLLVEMMSTASKMPCFAAGTTYTIDSLRERFMLNQSEESCIKKITDMIHGSVNNFRTVQYDNYQRLTNGIM